MLRPSGIEAPTRSAPGHRRVSTLAIAVGFYLAGVLLTVVSISSVDRLLEAVTELLARRSFWIFTIGYVNALLWWYLTPRVVSAMGRRELPRNVRRSHSPSVNRSETGSNCP